MKPTFKKLLWGGSVGVAALIMLPMVAAFEAHVINVTAQITNALEADVYSIDFGTVFPQEKFEKPFSIGLSESFQASEIYDDVEYVLRQKPKCARDPLANESLPPFGQAEEDENGNFICKDEANYNLMPFLCPYLSKAEQTTDGTAPDGENDMADPDPLPGHTGPLASFHGPILLSPPPGGWNMNTTLQYQLLGRLAKSEQDISDTWNIDLKVPCFGDHCAQDWADFVAANDGNNNAIAADYIQPIENEHQVFGCDLWVEVTELSLNPQKGILTVIKHTINDNGGQQDSPDFTMNVVTVGPNPAPFPGDEAGTVVAIDPGAYSVSETGTFASSYDSALSADCVGVIAAGEQKTCTITNDDKPATLVIHKTVINDNGGTTNATGFSYQVDGGSATSFPDDGGSALESEVSTPVSPGQYDVTEPAVPGYLTTYNNCEDVVVSVGETETCTITNNDQQGTLVIHKTVINDNGGTAVATNFSYEVNAGGPVAFLDDGGSTLESEVSLPVNAGQYDVTEPAVTDYTTLYNNCIDVDVANGETETCTITNNDNEPVLACDAALDTMLVLDRSGSISAAELQTLKTASHAFVDTLTPTVSGAHVGQASFSTTASLDQTLTGDEAAVHLAINGVSTGGSTDLEAGITTAITELGGGNDRTPDTDGDFPDAIVVVTDGNPNIPDETTGRTDAAAAADAARAAGIEVFVVGVGGDVDATYLETDIADDADHYFDAADFDDLEAVLQGIVACTSTLKRYTFAGVTQANDGTGGNPLALEHDSNLFPWTAAGDLNSSVDPSNTEYTNIATDNDNRWTSADPGTGDFMVKRFRFFLTEATADIDNIKFTWKGEPGNTANASIYVLKTGMSEFTAANWVQLGGSLNILNNTDRYMVRNIAAVDVSTYVAAIGGQIDVVVFIDNDSEDLATDYVQLLVTSSP